MVTGSEGEIYKYGDDKVLDVTEHLAVLGAVGIWGKVAGG